MIKELEDLRNNLTWLSESKDKYNVYVWKTTYINKPGIMIQYDAPTSLRIKVTYPKGID